MAPVYPHGPKNDKGIKETSQPAFLPSMTLAPEEAQRLVISDPTEKLRVFNCS